ncbi:MAG: hypothetical protein ACR2NP_03075, partial [Pirellulaceae bacterium]
MQGKSRVTGETSIGESGLRRLKYRGELERGNSMDWIERRGRLAEFCTSVMPDKLQLPGTFLPGLAAFLPVMLAIIVAGNDSLQAWQADVSSQPISSHGEELQIAGSRLLTPASFGFSIPLADLQPTEWSNVETLDDWGNPVTARVHAKVGDNFVVLLPNGRLVDRTAEQVQSTTESFEPAKPKDIA